MSLNSDFISVPTIEKFNRLEKGLVSLYKNASNRDKVGILDRLYKNVIAREKLYQSAKFDFTSPQAEVAFSLLLSQFRAALEASGASEDVIDKTFATLSESLVGFENYLNETLSGVVGQINLNKTLSELESYFQAKLSE